MPMDDAARNDHDTDDVTHGDRSDDLGTQRVSLDALLGDEVEDDGGAAPGEVLHRRDVVAVGHDGLVRPDLLRELERGRVLVHHDDLRGGEGGEGGGPSRHNLLRPYQVDARLMAHAAPDAIFQHCLPAHRGEEVAAEVIDGPQSVVFDEAENRLHAQKGVLLWALGAA